MLMHLLKDFDFIPHDLLTAKLSAYGLNGNALRYIYTYFTNRKQCVRVNVCSEFSFTLEEGMYITLLMIIHYHHLQNLLRR